MAARRPSRRRRPRGSSSGLRSGQEPRERGGVELAAVLGEGDESSVLRHGPQRSQARVTFLLEGLAEYRSLSGRDARSQARTQGAPVSSDTGATEDAAWGRAARPDGTAGISPSPPSARDCPSATARWAVAFEPRE